MEGERGTVCVTGGTGYLASLLIMKLLEQGYSVNTTVRPHPGKFSIYIFFFFGGGELRDRSRGYLNKVMRFEPQFDLLWVKLFS